MVLTKSYPALENVDSLEKSVLSKLPGDLLEAMEAFAERNSLAVVASSKIAGEEFHRCCENCLKAYALNKTGKWGIGKILSEKFKCELGHDGFFMDAGKLSKA